MKLLDQSILNILLTRFPFNNKKNYINHSNDSKILFSNDPVYYILKPKGKRSYIWFTYYEKKLLTLVIFINNFNCLNDKTNEFYEIDFKYDNTLCYNNVLLSGLYFTKKIENSKKNSNNTKILHYFVLNNLENYNIYNKIINKPNYNNNFKMKLNLFNILLPMLKNSNNNFKICLPNIEYEYNSIIKYIYNTSFNYHSIEIYNKNKYLGNYLLNNYNNSNNSNNPNKNNILNATFKVIACINNDIYSLFVNNNNNEEYFDLALIDSYKTSIFMNKLFRKIIENNNLDKIEESDDEDEFENNKIDKFVNLNSSYNILCNYNHIFKKWIPIKISNYPIIEKNKLNNLIKK